ncbi:MarR family winged helix-turn-helix transcriptional regulator [Cohnella panacarvi]|uniref:MarR family winged helix-turn-helix transcriptional regulator n=1 Tax=Cohnella panacarvi TaxID=400776 RepID=UPI00047E6DB1|nr:MarR family transcriptional regulator [Cohnella panacarvi]
MQRDAAISLDNQLCFAVYALSREITKRYQPYLKELGLTYTQYITMLALWEDDRVAVKQLGARLLLDSGTLTPLLKKLETMGHLTRSRDPSDERSVIIALTDQGKKLKEQARDVPGRMFCQAGVTLEEADALRKHIASMMTKVQPNGIEEELKNDDL